MGSWQPCKVNTSGSRNGEISWWSHRGREKVVETGVEPRSSCPNLALSTRGIFFQIFQLQICILCVSFTPPFRPVHCLFVRKLLCVRSVLFHSYQKRLFTPCCVHGARNCTGRSKRSGKQGLYSQEVYRQAVKRRQGLYLNYLNPMIFALEEFLLVSFNHLK